MRVVFLFAPAFHAWAEDILRKMHSNVPSLEVIGIATNSEIYNGLKQSDLNFYKLYDLSVEEESWIKDSLDSEQYKVIEKRVGSDVMMRTVIADKTLGSGWIVGADIFKTRLGEMAREHERLKSYIANMYQFYLDIFDRHSPDLTFLYAIAGGTTFALAAAAQCSGCRFRRFQHSRLDDHFIIDTSKEGLLEQVQLAMDDKNIIAGKQKNAKEWLKNYRANNRQPGFFIANSNHRKKNEEWSSILKHFAGITLRVIKKSVTNRGQEIRSKSEIMRFNNRVLVPVKKKLKLHDRYFEKANKYLETDYVYFPLHVEPEAATLVTAPYHANQLAVLENLSKSVPLSFKILVKEHPTMLGKRPVHFYKTLAKMPNIVLVDLDVSNFELIKHATLLATISGTTGWEGVLAKKPVLVLGEAPYLSIGEGIVHCKDMSALSAAVKEALSLKAASDGAIVNYIAAVMSLSIQFPAFVLWQFKAEYIKQFENITQQIANALIDAACHEGRRPNKKNIGMK